MLFDIFINDIGSITEYPLSEFADDTKLSGTLDSLEGRDDIQGDADRPEEQVHAKFRKFNKAKCKVLDLGQHSPTSVQAEE